MQIQSLMDSRSFHYVTLFLLLVALVGGGIITMACDEDQGAGWGISAEDQTHRVARRNTNNGVIEFNNLNPLNASSVNVVLDSEKKVNDSWTSPIVWEAITDKDKINPGSNVATIAPPNSGTRTAKFRGRYKSWELAEENNREIIVEISIRNASF